MDENQLIDRVFSMRVGTEENVGLTDILVRVRNGSERTKFRLYSTHDDSLSGLLAGLLSLQLSPASLRFHFIFKIYIQRGGFTLI